MTNRHPVLSYLSMILSENRLPLFRIMLLNLPPERRLVADQLAPAHNAHAGDKHVATHVVAVAAVADIADYADRKSATPVTMPVVVMATRIEATATAGLDDGEGIGGGSSRPGKRGGSGSDEYKLLHDKLPLLARCDARVGVVASGVR